ncbi:hypothetical protein ACLESO_37075 [Pyxidicoccus sp. 3LG]
MMDSLGQLVLMRLRMLFRQPDVLFWTFIFPIITTLVLGLAFRTDVLQPVKVAVADGPGAQALMARLEGAAELRVLKLAEADARRQLARGHVSLVLLAGAEPEAWWIQASPRAAPRDCWWRRRSRPRSGSGSPPWRR